MTVGKYLKKLEPLNTVGIVERCTCSRKQYDVYSKSDKNVSYIEGWQQ